MSPLANSFIPPERTHAMEPFYPLRAHVCSQCFLVQVAEYENPEQIFSDYAYFSSFSTTWLEHAQRFAEMATDRFALGPERTVVEVASNDGYLLRYFADAGIRVLGIEPAANVAAAAEANGVPTAVRFFGRQCALDLRATHPADLLVGNNVLAHVPDINDFVEGLALLLAPDGVVAMEFPHLMRLIDEVQFDTIYHEHFSYLSFSTVYRVFEAHGLTLFDVEELPTHGGSLRVFARRREDASRPVDESVGELLRREEKAGYGRIETYLGFAERMKQEKRTILSFLIETKQRGGTIVGYGAPAKGNTLLNYCGVGTDFLEYTVDRNPHKQGQYLPGTRIPIRAVDAIEQTRPDYVFVLPWNLNDEVMEQMAFVREWGGRFIVRRPGEIVYA